LAYFAGQTTLYDYINKVNIPNGDHTLNVNGVDIDIEMFNFEEDIIYNESPILGSNVSDSKMLILNYKGSLTINTGVIITPQVRKKGMTIAVRYNLINHGKISMTARGAISEGQDIYLYKNRDGTFEYIPAVGGSGGVATSGGGNSHGNAGKVGIRRGTGGGGSGSNWGTNSRPSGRGGSGTSYSGGSGGGGVYNTSGAGSYNGGSGSDTGGSGGNGTAKGSGTGAYGTGGVGNEPGKSGWSTTSTSYIGNVNNSYAQIGTGGLLIVYAKNILNNGKIESNGSDTIVNSRYSSSHTRFSGGGNSGGGSINLFYKKNYESNGEIIAYGGTTSVNIKFDWAAIGGDGGAGSITVQNILRSENVVLHEGKYKMYKGKWITVSEKIDQIDFETNGVLSEELNRTAAAKSIAMTDKAPAILFAALELCELKKILNMRVDSYS